MGGIAKPHMASVDLARLLQFQCALYSCALVGIAPAYDLPIVIYGLFGQEDTAHLSNFIALLTLSELLDLVWLYHWKGSYGTLSGLLVIAGFAAKIVAFLAAQAQLANRGQSAFPGLGDGNSQTIFSAVPGAFQSRPQGNQNSSSYQGQGGGFFADEAEDEEADVGVQNDKSKQNSA